MACCSKAILLFPWMSKFWPADYRKHSNSRLQLVWFLNGPVFRPPFENSTNNTKLDHFASKKLYSSLAVILSCHFLQFENQTIHQVWIIWILDVHCTILNAIWTIFFLLSVIERDRVHNYVTQFVKFCPPPPPSHT